MRKSIMALLGAALLAGAAPAAAHAALTPNDLHRVYALPKTGAAHQTIAIVSAYDDPHVEADLNDYTKRFGIRACTKANGCFRVLNQSGATGPLPQKDPTGGTFITESSTGVEIARGICQSCAITLVEANSLSAGDLSAAAGTAARSGAQTIVTSFNIPASGGTPQYAAEYTHPGSIVVAASGDSGFGFLPTFPSSLPGVLAVGGTQLNLARGGAYGSETAWGGTSSGCSPSDPAASWQTALARSVGCGSKRAVADIAAAANPGPLVHIQDLGDPCGPDWCEVDGTSVAAPIIAGVIGLAGSQGAKELPMLYAHAHSDPSALRDVKSGMTQNCTGGAICTARRGYDGPTGLGTPYGLGGFLANGGAVDKRHPNLSVSATHNRLSVSRSWTTKLTLRNDNPFAVRVRVVLTRRMRVSGKTRVVTFASANITVGPLAGTTKTLTIARSQRGLLGRLRKVGVTVAMTARGSAGRATTVNRGLPLYAP